MWAFFVEGDGQQEPMARAGCVEPPKPSWSRAVIRDPEAGVPHLPPAPHPAPGIKPGRPSLAGAPREDAS